MELNGNRGMKRIVLIIMSVLLAQNILGQEFSSFYIDFMLRPEQQGSKVKFPLRVGESTIRNSRSYKPFLLTNPNDFMIVCSDSLSHSVSTNESWTALYSYHTKQLIKQQNSVDEKELLAVLFLLHAIFMLRKSANEDFRRKFECRRLRCSMFL